MEGDEALDVLIPAKAGELELAKLAAPSRVVIYSLDGVPVLLDTSGKVCVCGWDGGMGGDGGINM